MRVEPVIALLTALLPALPAPAAQSPARLPPTARAAQDSLVSFDGRAAPVERVTLAIREVPPGSSDTVRFDVTFLRLAAQTPSGRSPIVFLMGGPGVPASVIGRIPPYWTLFDRLRADADVILLDQRGVGLSRPTVECPPGSRPSPDLLASLRHLTDGLAAAYAPCVAHWRSRGVPAELISVEAIAADIEDIRIHLGVPRLALLGFSFGTRLALEYMKRFPDRADRAVLQGVLGFDNVVRLPATLDSMLERVSAAAARDSVARTLVPDLRAALAERFSALERQPLELTVTRAPADTVRLVVGREGLQAIITGRLADPRLPALVASLAEGDMRVLAAMAGGIYFDLASGGGSLFGRAVYCSAPGPEAREHQARRQASESVLGEVFDNVPTSPAFCRNIGIRPSPRAAPPERALAQTALLITGTLDDRTAPGNAEWARRYFTEATAVVVENGGHELLPVEPVQALVVEFLASGRVTTERLTLPAPRFATIEEALRPPRRR